jgi:crotonobetainyl-CoA:carnitine CoA-transferase CaiB-like acyl-CoA transferase
MLSSPDADWADLLEHLGRPDLGSDSRFATAAARSEYRAEAIAVLDELFGQHTYDELRQMLATTRGVWEPIQTPAELHHDPQTVANGFIRMARHADGRQTALPIPPILFDGDSGEPQPGPDWGEHTDQVLAELGMSVEEIDRLRQTGVVK